MMMGFGKAGYPAFYRPFGNVMGSQRKLW